MPPWPARTMVRRLLLLLRCAMQRGATVALGACQQGCHTAAPTLLGACAPLLWHPQIRIRDRQEQAEREEHSAAQPSLSAGAAGQPEYGGMVGVPSFRGLVWHGWRPLLEAWRLVSEEGVVGGALCWGHAGEVLC